MKTISWTVNINTVSEANSSEHWTLKSKRHKNQQLFVRLSFEKYVKDLRLPCLVTITRFASRDLDDDNLVSSLKWIRDEISECILPDKRGIYVDKKGKVKQIKGRADCDPRIRWSYKQERNSIKGIKVEIQFEDT